MCEQVVYYHRHDAEDGSYADNRSKKQRSDSDGDEVPIPASESTARISIEAG